MNKSYLKQSWEDNFIEALQRGTKKSVRKAFNKKNSHIPNTLFRYRPWNEYTVDEIKNQYIYMSKPSDFNDPFDSSARKSIEKMILKDKKIKEHIRELRLSGNVSNDSNVFETAVKFLANIQDKNFSDHLRNELRVTCFTDAGSNKKPINLPMWYHYANKYQGVCIEYDIKNSLKAEKRWIFPVKYTNKPLNFLHYISDTKIPIAEILISIHKDKTWSYENEWRFISCKNLCPQDQKYKFSAIKAVYIGYKASDKTRNEVLSLSRNMFKVYNMKLKHDCIDFEEL